MADGMKKFLDAQTEEERKAIWKIRDTVPLEQRREALVKLLGRTPNLMESSQAGLAHVLWDEEETLETEKGPDPFDGVFKIFPKK